MQSDQKQNTATAPKGAAHHASGNAIGIKPPPAYPVSQLVRKKGNDKWSDSYKYVTNIAQTNTLACDAGDLPAFPGAKWSKAGEAQYNTSARNVKKDRWIPKWNDDSAMKVPKDCLTTAELVSAWLMGQDPQVVGQVLVNPTIAEADHTTTVGPGDIMFHVHDLSTPGDFHGVGVIAADGDDVVTMESDATQSGNSIASSNPIFDMYAGHAGFKASQNQGSVDEKTYVMHLAQGRSGTDKLFASVQGMKFTSAGKEAANKIIQAMAANLGTVIPKI